MGVISKQVNMVVWEIRVRKMRRKRGNQERRRRRGPVAAGGEKKRGREREIKKEQKGIGKMGNNKKSMSFLAT
jgi:hypothetical protein